MEKVTTVSGIAAPLMRAQIDTDIIIRIERLTSLGKDALGAYAFEALRYRPDGSENPDFVLNQQDYQGAPILIAGANFGCGSSREGAVWALMACGIRAVVAESFGDIFYNNCFQNGLLPVVLPAEAVERLAEAARMGVPLTVDLQAQEVGPARDRSNWGEPIRFEIDPQRREVLLLGLDDLGQTLRHSADIAAWQERDRAARPWIWSPGAATDERAA